MINAVTVLNIVNGSPSKAVLRAKESIPISGVLTKKDAVDPLLAPAFRSEAATGMTLQEHSGSGKPKIDDFKMLLRPGLPSWLRIQEKGIKACASPAKRNPASKKRLLSWIIWKVLVSQVEKKSIKVFRPYQV